MRERGRVLRCASELEPESSAQRRIEPAGRAGAGMRKGRMLTCVANQKASSLSSVYSSSVPPQLRLAAAALAACTSCSEAALSVAARMMMSCGGRQEGRGAAGGASEGRGRAVGSRGRAVAARAPAHKHTHTHIGRRRRPDGAC